MHPKTAYQPKGVLLVEDDLDYANMLKMMLVSPIADSRVSDAHQCACIRGQWIVARVGTLTEAREVLAKTDATHFDLVLLDLNLPDGEGEMVAREVRRLAPDLPIVVQSGLDDTALALRLLECQIVQDYLLKANNQSSPTINSLALKQTLCAALDKYYVQRDSENITQRIEQYLGDNETVESGGMAHG